MGSSLAEMESLCSFNQGVKYLLRVLDIFTKDARVKKSKAVLYAFIEIVNESKLKPNKLWID